jgi:hypothetical protein
VRKKLRTSAQLLAHCSAGLQIRGLQGDGQAFFAHGLRNFLRMMAMGNYGVVSTLTGRPSG